MRWSVTALLTVVASAALASGAHVQVTKADADSKGGSGLEVAIAEKGRCARFADAADGIVAVTDAGPGDQSPVTRLCLKTAGRARVHLGIRDLVDLERGCTGGEASVDPTCGAGAPGELAGSLVQLLSVEQRCFTDAPLTRHPLPALAETPLDLGVLDDQRVVCVVLAARYDPATAEAAHAAQSDRAEWRYVLRVTD